MEIKYINSINNTVCGVGRFGKENRELFRK